MALARCRALAVLAAVPLLAVCTPPSDGPTGPLLAVVAALAWTCTAWLALLAALVLTSRLPGAAGAAARALVHQCAPGSVRRLLALALGATALASVAAAPAGASPRDPLPSLDWPGTAVTVVPEAQPTGSLGPTPPSLLDAGLEPGLGASLGPDLGAHSPQPAAGRPSPPATTAPRETAPSPAPRAQPHATVTTPASLPLPAARSAAPGSRPISATPPQAHVVVRPGDSLWALAARALGPHPPATQVAQSWPRWWAANRALLGDEPDLLHPGDVLVPPT